MIKQVEQLGKALATHGRIILELQHQVNDLRRQMQQVHINLATQDPAQQQCRQAPTLSDVVERLATLQLNCRPGTKPCRPSEDMESLASDFFNHYESTGWLIREGVPLVNWQARLQQWFEHGRHTRQGSTRPDFQNSIIDRPWT